MSHYPADSTTPRGIRNNNPGNIRKSNEKWKGLAAVQTDAEFFTFASAQDGIRAMTKIIRNYGKLYGLHTVRSIVTRWAPPNENDSDAYVRAVAKRTGYSADERLNLNAPHVAEKLVRAIIHHENGRQPYDNATITRGVRAAYA